MDSVKVLNETVYNPANDADVIDGYIIIGYLNGDYILVPEWYSYKRMYHVLRACGFAIGDISQSIIYWLGLPNCMYI